MLRITEKILLRQIKKGDEQAFTTFYNTFRSDIYRFVYFRVSNDDKANDLTNEIFIKIFDYIKTGEDIENFRAFVFKTARNIVIDFYRTRKDEISLDKAPEIPDDQETDIRVDKNIQIQNIKKYLDKIKPEYAQAVKLRFFDELSFIEIANILGQSEANVRMRAHRGIKQLRKALTSKP